MLYKSDVLTLEPCEIVGWLFLMINVITHELLEYSWYIDEYCCMGPSGRFTHVYVILNYLGQVMFLGRAPRTNETLPDFRERCRVTRHLRVFSRVDG